MFFNSGNVVFTLSFTSGSRLLLMLASMAARNKQRRRSKAPQKVTFEPEENEEEAGSGSGAEDEDPAADEREDKATKGEDEFSLEEVLRLGGTQVSSPGESSRDTYRQPSCSWRESSHVFNSVDN